VHFLPGAPAAAVGHKAVGRVLSDIAAMGATPRWALINLVAPPRTTVATLDGLYDGALALAGRHGLAIVGGDMSEGPVLELHVFAAGSVPRGKAVRRSGARPGEAVFVTGELGGSIAGKHLAFEPRTREGAWLRDWATAMIDVSDGLASDLRHLILESGTGCELEAEAIPLSEAVRQQGEAALGHALYDGEDFELLFTVPAAAQEPFLAAWRAKFPLPCSRIGTMTDRPGRVECRRTDGSPVPVRETAYVHFRRA
jgi:thiamine-monophosphate kinase